MILPLLDARHAVLYVTAGDVAGLRQAVRGQIAGRMRLPDESLGGVAVTLLNVVAGSFYRFETLTGDLVEAGTAASATVALTLPAFANGDPKNSLRVKVRKASAAPFYQPFETQLTLVAGVPQSIFVNQVRDDI